jgi:hypothetical protein
LKKTTILIVAVVSIVVLIFLGAQYISSEDFTLENPYWNGIASLSAINAHPLYDISSLPNASASDTLLIISPQRNYTADESQKIAAFAQAGGRVVIMDDFGDANSLLSAMGSPITINQTPLCDYDSYYVNYSFPAAKDIVSSPETANVSQIVFNHPAALDVSGNSHLLASTTDHGWLDTNDNAALDGNERFGKYCLAAKADYGSGEIIVVSDPDLFINSMIDLGDNRAFMAGILPGTVWVDASHGRGVTPVGVVYYALKYDILAQAAILLLAIGCGIVYVKRREIFK